jgi:hypothetical protein
MQTLERIIRETRTIRRHAAVMDAAAPHPNGDVGRMLSTLQRGVPQIREQDHGGYPERSGGISASGNA